MKTIEELEAELETVTRERDKLLILVELSDGYRRERDELRAEVERLERELPVHPSNLTDVVSLLEDERDELLVRVANQDAELRATREAYNEARAELTRERIGIRPVDEVRSDAYRRGAEAMRDECIGAACGFFMGTTGFCNGDEDALEAVLEALPIPEEP